MTEFSAYMLSAVLEGEFILYRGRGDGLPPILLVAAAGAYPSPSSLQRLEHQFALRADLDATWAARPIELIRRDARPMLVLEDPGGEPLELLLGRPLEIGPFQRIAVSLAAAIGRMHSRGLVHKDLKPAHILVDLESDGVWLTGFGIATRVPRERQVLAPPEVIAGTLAYMAPEQTGRMNRSIDVRSDLYALGVILYEMLTGVLPFTASDPMEWIHCHIARQPISPGERVIAVPEQISAIVMKLLEKTAETRYQTAAGVEVDLRQCLATWDQHGRIDRFPLGGHDVSDRLLIPEKLYGREKEIELLLAAYDRVVGHGAPELVLVSGYAGVGKSSVVNELHKALVPQRGLFAAGKFDQFNRDIPYATLAQAFESLVRHLLSTDDAELNRWRTALQEALGPNGQLMVNLIPELGLVIGEQPPVPDLAPQDRQKRFQLVFRRLLGVFARPEHPLALFLDDLQWLDAATLELIEHLLTEPDVQHLLLVGAYRDNEVDASHPLMRTLEMMRRAGGRVREIVLTPLRPDDIGQLIAESLHCESGIAQPLAQLVHEKTDGNPFFAVQFFLALAEEALLVFDHRAGAWTWDLPRIHAKGFTDNVADLMAAKLSQLPGVTQDALGHLACLGNVASVTALTSVHGATEQKVHEELWEAVRAGLVFDLGDAYAFLHDRVQEAAYALIPESERAVTHLRIGQALASRVAPGELEEVIFDVVNHLNRGVEMITTQQERERVAELNLMAARRAKNASAYASALQYLTIGGGLMAEAEDYWERRYDVAFALARHRAECELLIGDFSAAEERLSQLSRRSGNLADDAAVACLRMDLYTLLVQNDSAVAVCLNYLRRVGIEWSPHPTDHDVREEYEQIWRRLGSRPIEQLIDLPLMTDPATRATMDVLTKLMPPAFMTDENLACLMSARMVNLSLEYGNSNASCCGYIWFSMVLGPYFGDYPSASRFSQLSVDLIDERGLDAFMARVYMNFGNGNAWTRDIRSSAAYVQRAFDAANRVGDLVYAGHCCNNLVSIALASGEPLSDVERDAVNGLDTARKLQFGIVVDMIIGQLRLIRMLRGMTSEFASFNDAGFDAAAFEQHLEANPNLALPACFYWVRKLQAQVWANDHVAALAAAARAEKLLWTSRWFLEHAEYHFYAGLAHAAACNVAPESGPHLKSLAAHHRQLEIWAQHCPENFADRRVLLAAEIARLEGRILDAESLYEDALGLARANGFVQNEALGNELAARFYATRGFATIADSYLRKARDCCLRWGAGGKLRQLEQSHPQLRPDLGAEAPPVRLTTTLEAPQQQLDVAAVVKIYQTLSSEIVLEKLIETLMVIAVEHAGAERGLLVLPHGAEQRIEAEATTSRDAVIVRLLGTPATPSELPESVLQYVIRTQDSVMLDDATAQNLFSADAYIHQKHARSVLCLPLVKQAKLIGTLYLENNLASHVFTSARIAVLKLMASQAAISIENARLYAELIKENTDRRKAEDDLRRSEELLAQSQQIGNTGSWRWNVGTGEVRWSAQHFRSFGFDPVATEPSYAAFIDRLHPEDRPAFEQALDQAVRERSRFEHEYRIGLPDGAIKYMQSVGQPENTEAGGLEFVGTVMDITERRRAEEALRTVQAELVRVARLTTMGELVASIAHEINQPLAGVAARGSACLRWLGINPTSTQRANPSRALCGTHTVRAT
jgi:predicted ATPase/GAF domain-containing protein